MSFIFLLVAFITEERLYLFKELEQLRGHLFCEGHALTFVLQLVEVEKEKKEILQRCKLLSTSVTFYVGPPTPFFSHLRACVCIVVAEERKR